MWDKIKKAYLIDEGFYPNRSLFYLPDGAISEIDNIYSTLVKANYEPTIENIVNCMYLKRNVLEIIDNDEKDNFNIKKISENKVGAGFGIEYVIASIIFASIIMSCSGFFSEFGKDVYQKLKDHIRNKTKNNDEYEVVSKIASEAFKNDDIQEIILKLKKK